MDAGPLELSRAERRPSTTLSTSFHWGGRCPKCTELGTVGLLPWAKRTAKHTATWPRDASKPGLDRFAMGCVRLSHQSHWASRLEPWPLGHGLARKASEKARDLRARRWGPGCRPVEARRSPALWSRVRRVRVCTASLHRMSCVRCSCHMSRAALAAPRLEPRSGRPIGAKHLV